VKKNVFIACALFLFFIDFSLKRFVIDHQEMLLSGKTHFNIQIFPFLTFELTYVENTGMAWGLFSSFQNSILLIRILVIMAIAIGLLMSATMQKMFFPFLLILFGAFANVLDTFLYGHVVDMLNFIFFGRSYGIFNIADAMIFFGALFILCKKEGAHIGKQ
jgi:lipoprotein signal peptidase